MRMDDLVEPLLSETAIKCLGVDASLRIDEHSSSLSYIPFVQQEGSSRKCRGIFCCASCCRCRPQHMRLQIPLQHVVGAALESPNSFRVWYFEQRKQQTSSSNQAPRFKPKKTLPFVCSSGTEATAFVSRVRQVASWQGSDKQPQVVAIINPKSGQGRAYKLFQQQVLPVLEDAAGMSVHTLVTQHAGHATQLVAELQLMGLDMLVFVGGDGTVFEGLQGLLGRPDWSTARLLPIAHVPGGSGNGLAHSCGLQDAATAALAICKAVVSPMDVASVLQPPNQRRYMMLLATYGSMSNLDVGTEPLRWVGDARFTLGALWEILKSNSYHAGIAWVPGEGLTPASVTGSNAAGCGVDAHDVACSSSSFVTGDADTPSAAAVLPVSVGSQSVTSPTAHQQLLAGPAPSVSLQDFPPGPELPLLAQLGGRLPLMVPRSASELNSSWRVWHDPLQMWCLVNPPFIAANYKINPLGALNTGVMNMMWVAGLVGLNGRLQALDVHVKAEQGLHITAPCLTQHTVRAMIFEPRDSNTYLQLDGEVIPSAPIFLEVHQGLIRVTVNPAHPELGLSGQEANTAADTDCQP